MNNKRAFGLITLLIFLAIGILIFFDSLVNIWNTNEVGVRVKRLLNLEDGSGKKKILLWNSAMKDEWDMGKSDHFEHCTKYKNCYLTHVRNLVSIPKFDAILFEGKELHRDDLPEKRDPIQKYVFVSSENPVNEPLVHSFFKDYFNMTMTYRLNSDILKPRSILRNIDTLERVAPLQRTVWVKPSHDPLRWKLNYEARTKTKLAAWMTENCESNGGRKPYVQELKKFMQVDVVGKCGSLSCPKSGDCFAKLIERDYLFYFAFEDTLCTDYITENFFNALRSNVVPVVYGGADYSLFAPPLSYIDALDFDGPKALADFLIDLSQDREEYQKYFWWKTFYTVESAKPWILCNLCEVLNDPKPRKLQSSLTKWSSKDECPIHTSLNGAVFASKSIRARKNKKLIH